MGRKIFFAIQLWGNENILSLFSEIERLGYDGAYYGDGPFKWLSDCFSILAASSLVTNTMRIGPVVTYLDGSYRSLVATIKALVTISNLSKGRLDARFGFIKEDARPYWKEFDIVLPSLKERIDRVEEGLFISKQIFTKGGINFEGKYHRLNISEFTPKPLFSIPVWIAAMGKKTIKIALRYADVWEVSFIPPEHLAKLIEEHRTLISRRNVEISLEVDVIIGKDRREFEKRFSKYLAIRGVSKHHWIVQSAIKGDSDQCINKIQEFIDVGVKKFILTFNEIPDLSGLKIFASEVLNSF